MTLTGRRDRLTIGDGARLTLAGATAQSTGLVIGDVALGPPSSLVVPAGGTLGATGTARIGDAATGILDVSGGSATIGTTIVGGPEEAGGQALTLPRAERLPGAPAADALPEQAGGKIRVRGGGATFASLAIGGGTGLRGRAPGQSLRVSARRVSAAAGPGFVVVEGAAGDAFTTCAERRAAPSARTPKRRSDVLSGGRVTAPSLDLGAEVAGNGRLQWPVSSRWSPSPAG
jgi:hypothetical protein